MTTLEVRLDSLRTAAAEIERANREIAASLEAVQSEVAGLYALGMPAGGVGAFSAMYAAEAGTMSEWPLTLARFASNLQQAADDIQQAMNQPGRPIAPLVLPYIPESVPLALWGHGFSTTKKPTALVVDTSEPPVIAEPLPLGSYVAAINQPLYTVLQREQQGLSSNQLLLSVLMQTRETRLEDLTALKNNLLSYDPNTDLRHTPRVQALETEIAGYDGQIASTQQTISQQQATINSLTERLNRVRPGAGADVTLLQELEYGQTNQWVKANTQDCVNYIVSRVPVPDGLARDAYLWNEQAAKLTQYGVTGGSTPLVGSILVMEKSHPYADPVYGHLMLVQAVDADGSVWVTDNNHPTVPVKLGDLTTETGGSNISYLYLSWFTQG
ncbi:MAG: CHAP domain-containing protein [Chloroflexi bacterium]|nr:CHAP domain-containing protein [Chloroflexota bacterium]